MPSAAILNDPEVSVFAGLRYVSLRLLWDCNLRCIMCDHPHKPKSEMSEETAMNVLGQLTKPLRLTFIGGEPVLWLLRYPQVLRRALNDGHVVHLISNGVLLPKLIDFVEAFSSHTVSVQLSIDGFGETYERIRKRSHWSAVVDVIRLLNSKRVEGNNKNAIITTNYLLMRSTLEDLPKFVAFCAEESIDAVSLTYAMIYDSMVIRGDITETESVFHHKSATNGAVRAAISVARAKGISLSYPAPLGDTNLHGRQWVGAEVASVAPGKSYVPNIEPPKCGKPWKEIFVNQDGTVIPCCCGPGIGPIVGHIRDGLENLWNGKQIRDVRRALVQGQFHGDCHCGINISEVGRQTGPKDFFTKLHRTSRPGDTI